MQLASPSWNKNQRTVHCTIAAIGKTMFASRALYDYFLIFDCYRPQLKNLISFVSLNQLVVNQLKMKPKPQHLFHAGEMSCGKYMRMCGCFISADINIFSLVVSFTLFLLRKLFFQFKTTDGSKQTIFLILIY